MSVLSLDATLGGWLPLEDLDVLDLESVRLLLRGDSSIDWHRLNFRSVEEVNHFLRVHLFEPNAIEDVHRMRVLHDHALQYLRNHFKLIFPEDLVKPGSIQSIFLHASFGERRFNRRKLLSCMLLKVMSIVHHLESRSLVFRTRLSEADIFGLVEGRMRELDGLIRRSRAPVREVYGSRKSRDSLVSKLLSKRETFAAAVFDKFRYRIVVNEQKDLFPAVAFLLRHFIPFNYIVPGQSVNNLLDPKQCLQGIEPKLSQLDGVLSNYKKDEGWGFRDRRSNEFSGSSYKMINFICDIPVRLDAFLTKAEIRENGRIGFVLVELQIVDSETDARNEWGANSHAAYKERRKARVLERLRWGGMLKPSLGGPESPT